MLYGMLGLICVFFELRNVSIDFKVRDNKIESREHYESIADISWLKLTSVRRAKMQFSALRNAS